MTYLNHFIEKIEKGNHQNAQYKKIRQEAGGGRRPNHQPTKQPSYQPINLPTCHPTILLSSYEQMPPPSPQPTKQPTYQPTLQCNTCVMSNITHRLLSNTHVMSNITQALPCLVQFRTGDHRSAVPDFYHLWW